MFKPCQRIHGSALNTEKSRNFDVYQNVLSVGRRMFSPFGRIVVLGFWDFRIVYGPAIRSIFESPLGQIDFW
jgi:hypothetical protein